ncbi:hypothetical protein [Acinetobacter radioresistens]|jgi:hypothetical protein|uniref:hypothetical protein n=1 Tax=Acinetobacter radioresistens TaxID=40216 RepID=UPI00148EC35B|nr:hypothetical protein [Acinetobacter radioresistens]
MTEKCESCRKGFNGQNGNGYMPCGCTKIIKVAILGAESKQSKARALIDALLAQPPRKP